MEISFSERTINILVDSENQQKKFEFNFSLFFLNMFQNLEKMENSVKFLKTPRQHLKKRLQTIPAFMKKA